MVPPAGLNAHILHLFISSAEFFGSFSAVCNKNRSINSDQTGKQNLVHRRDKDSTWQGVCRSLCRLSLRVSAGVSSGLNYLCRSQVSLFKSQLSLQVSPQVVPACFVLFACFSCPTCLCKYQVSLVFAGFFMQVFCHYTAGLSCTSMTWLSLLVSVVSASVAVGLSCFSMSQLFVSVVSAGLSFTTGLGCLRYLSSPCSC